MRENCIFINCPFDDDYRPLLRALLFAVCFYGLSPKIASEESDMKSDRLRRIIKLMKSAKYSIHDLSRMCSRAEGEYYRMNMPFELGLDYGLCGQRKSFLIFENNPYKLKIALSDVNGWDVSAHKEEAELIIQEFRKWYVANNHTLSALLKSVSSEAIWVKYNEFHVGLEQYKRENRLKDAEISVAEYISYVQEYFQNG